MILNSLSCVLSYNYYDYNGLLHDSKKKDGKDKVNTKKVLHESTLVRQILYFCLVFILLLTLTVATLVRLDLEQDFPLEDQDGNKKCPGCNILLQTAGHWLGLLHPGLDHQHRLLLCPSIKRYLGHDI